MSGARAAACVITGAAGDLGRALSERFAADGYTVFAADVREVAAGQGIVPVRLDVTDRATVFALAHRAAAESDGLKLWINGAGILRTCRVTEADPEDWARIIAVNLTGTWHGCAAALEVMAAGGGGRIVNLGSLAGQVGGVAIHPAYGASKAGVHALTRTYALEGARHGVYCNAVAPSVIEGRMGSLYSESQRERLAAACPLRRLADVPEVVDAVRYLARPGASYTTGVVLPVNGGVHLA